jgi:hypothetical protein
MSESWGATASRSRRGFGPHACVHEKTAPEAPSIAKKANSSNRLGVWLAASVVRSPGGDVQPKPKPAGAEQRRSVPNRRLFMRLTGCPNQRPSPMHPPPMHPSRAHMVHTIHFQAFKMYNVGMCVYPYVVRDFSARVARDWPRHSVESAEQCWGSKSR